MSKIFCAFLFIPTFLFSQSYQQSNSAQIKLKLKKLNVLGTVLYMAAHPDDENTKIITYLSNEKLATTAYLSLTRGDGGQNLIGSEIRDLLGVIRTQELLAARRIDGGQQFFTRANDFGFSKNADETFQIWGKHEVLSDVVRVFRQYQPDVIITRFPPDQRAGHGHHTASAMLAHEAFDIAADPTQYPELAKQFGTWTPKRLYTNTGRWWNKDINENTPGVITLDIGGYSPLLGRSYSEIAARSSSQHKSQGWGTEGVRGYQPEFLEYQKGERAQRDIFEGINTTWTRVNGGEKVQPLVDRLIREFDEENPAASVPLLFQLRKEISGLGSSVWKDRKLAETEQLIIDCLGLFLETTSSYTQGNPGAAVDVSLELVSRSAVPVVLNSITSTMLSWDTTSSETLKPNVTQRLKTKKILLPNARYSNPYWLSDPHGLGLFTVKNQEQIGLPENAAAVDFVFNLTVSGEKIAVKRPLIYKWTDPVKGELWRPFEIVPPVFINPSDKVLIFSDAQPKELVFKIHTSSADSLSGNLRLELPAGWRAEPAESPFEFTQREQELTRVFTIYPSSSESNSAIKAVASIEGKNYDQSVQFINYDHIPIQTLLPKAQVKAVRLDLKKAGKMIGYIRGAGDEIPSALRNMGYEVWEMKNEEVSLANLKRVDAVVLGIRAMNTNERIRYFMTDLLEYVNQGGTLIVQYNTNFELQSETFSPFPIKLGRDRVTEENAEVRILKPDHPLLQYPNKITSKDFEGWVQERGLYFPTQWDPQYEALLSMNDSNEKPKDGSLLVARYGKGYYIYTGLSFFRELPEGVSGAYKLFANFVSIGKNQPAQPEKTKRKTK
jgi:LmbE family N-acetylglucosaminyl deacetylase